MPKKQNLPKGKKPTNEHQKTKYRLHYPKVLQNKVRRMKKHLKQQPNDRQTSQTIDNLL